ncbi:HemK2/MTQ2 family protein methyltransferase [Nonomuraea soli]|uniref:Release factor glutamine methyltransferase n=1 Tax=Nonomuraea soli TaxID=1032476 RepID=A0A7W0HQY3_9ACTN|nr:HemK2/MTQ2 family protein methyltransferase [Nonomuraea soli]MBA2892448.1 release factor glutamine methyltransferase [Nonomuraea soli]
MFLLRPPGVYRPQGDTALLSEALGLLDPPDGASILDICSGTGVMSVIAARHPGARVTAVDLSLRAVFAAWFNTVVRGRRVRVLRGDLFDPLAGEQFDVILANPPYVAGRAAAPGAHSRARAWDAGLDGRRLVDRICAAAPRHLAPGGSLLMVHSALSGVEASLRRLRAAGLRTHVMTRRPERFGPVMRARVAQLEAQGLIRPGQREEELVVICAQRQAAEERRIA